MKKWIYLLLLAVALFMTLITGVYAPVLALTYHDIYIDFREHEVTDYSGISIVLNSDTNALGAYIQGLWWFNYKMDSCPSGIIDKRLRLRISVINELTQQVGDFNTYIDVPCSTTYQTYYSDFLQFYFTEAQSQLVKNALTGDDANYLRATTYIYDNYNATEYNGIRIDLRNLQIETRFFYEFNTTYYFDYLALDSNTIYVQGNNIEIISGGVTPGNANVYLVVAYDSTDYYRLWNSDPTYSTNRGRKKYNLAIGEKITSYGIGVATYIVAEYQSAYYTKSVGITNQLFYQSVYYLLNYSNTQQSFPGADTLPIWEYDTCNAWDIPCHLGNALVYLAKDAPITSDIYQIASSGWQFISNGFYAVTSLFGANFDENGNLLSGNAFGVLLLISLGTLLISWGVSGDE